MRGYCDREEILEILTVLQIVTPHPLPHTPEYE
jgi:hypothetical protein